MKRIFAIVMVLCLVAAMGSVAFAQEAKGDFLMFGGNGKDGSLVPAGYKEVANGIQFKAATAYATAADSAAANGFVYVKELDVNNIKVEFSIDKLASNSKEDSWVCLNFLNDKKVFNISAPTKASGLVTLIRNYDGIPSFQMFALDDLGFTLIADCPIPDIDVTGKYTVELKRDAAKNSWQYLVNGQKLDDKGNLSLLSADLFKNGKAYVNMGASNLKYSETAYTINKIQGKTAKLAAAAEKPVEKAADKAEATEAATENPKTGDAGILVYVGAALVSGAALVGMKVRRK